jgi:UPF0755 protein
MSPRGGGDRTPEEREAARRARERRRYKRAGEPIPEHLLEPDERAAAAPPPPPPARAYEPAAVEPEYEAPPEHVEPEYEAPPEHVEPEYEAPPEHVEPEYEAPPEHVEREPFVPFAEEPVAHEPAPPASEPAPEPRIREAGAPAPREADPAHHELQETQQWDVNEAWVGEDHALSQAPEAPAPELEPMRDPAPRAVVDGPATDEHEREEPLGTRRVSGVHLPHIHRPTRGGKRRSDVPRPGRGRGVRVKRPGEMASGGARRRRSAGPRIAALVVVLLAVVLVWFLNSLFQPFGGGDGSGGVVVRIPNGASSGEIADLLETRGVIPSSFFFGLRASLSGKRSELKSGTYRLRRDMGYGAALDALTKVEQPAEVPVVHVAIPEGRSRPETDAIARRAGLRGDYVTASRRSAELNPTRFGAPRGATLEGFLFPATYELNRGARAQRLVEDQLRAFKQNFATVNLGYASSKRLTAFDVLTIASMVEREVSIPRERPLVAAVIYNRLRDGMALGIDATLRFEQNDWVNPLKQSVIDADTPYNTRTKPGLPPGPIGSPGLASIQAAARPARSNALYYVVKPGACGEHAFSDTFERFQADVATYNQARAAAGGKSPQRC